jgi:molecular chaperone DnaK (HSP70)
MKLGIDFGTTRIVAAAADRGNYPLVGFESPDGQAREWFPPLVAIAATNAASAGTRGRCRAIASGPCCARSSGC